MQSTWFIKNTCLVLLVYSLMLSSVSANTTEFPKNFNLWEGSAEMFQIGVYGSCDTQIRIVSPYEASFDLFAVKNNGTPGTCPSNLDVITHYDKASFSNRGRAGLDLQEGLWCVVVHARSGSGSVLITAESSCINPGPKLPLISHSKYIQSV